MHDLFLKIIFEYGNVGIFLVAFLAATLLPFSSELALSAGLLAGLDPYELLLWASLGNCLACLVNYGLGYFLGGTMHARLTRSRSGRLAMERATRYGPWSLLLSWLPIIGDPITVAAGFFRFSPVLFTPVVCGLRIGRYFVLLGIFS